MPLPEKYHLDAVRKLRGEAHVTFPGADTSVLHVERVFTVPRGSTLPAFLTADEEYASAKLVEQQVTGGDANYVEVYRLFHTLPGVEVVKYTVDEETRSAVTITTQLIQKPATPFAQTPGTQIDYEPINSVYGNKITTVINGGTAPATRTEHRLIEFTYPALLANIVGTPVAGRDAVLTQSVRRNAFACLAQGYTEFRYGVQADLETTLHTLTNAAFPDFWNPRLNDLVYSGIAFSVDERNVLNNALSLTYGSATLSETVSFAASTPTEAEYTAQLRAHPSDNFHYMLIGANLAAWRAGWWRLELSYVAIQ